MVDADFGMPMPPPPADREHLVSLHPSKTRAVDEIPRWLDILASHCLKLPDGMIVQLSVRPVGARYGLFAQLVPDNPGAADIIRFHSRATAP